MRGEFSDHLREMFRFWVLIVLIAALAGAATWVWRSSTPEVYTATTVAQVVVQQNDRSDDGTITEFRSRTLAELATTPAILEPAVAQSGLSIDVTDAADRTRIELSDSTGFIEVSADGPTPADAVALSDAIVATMSSSVVRDRVPGSQDELRIVQRAQAPASPGSNRGVELGTLAALVAALVTAEATVAIRVLRGKLSPVNAAADLERATGLPTFDLRPGEGDVTFFRHHLASLPVITVLTTEGADVGFGVDIARMSAAIHDRVLLIDGSQHQHHIHTHLGVARSPGLTEFARGEVSLGDAVHPGPLGARIVVLTCGSAPSVSVHTKREAIARAIENSGADQSIVVEFVADDFADITSLWRTASPVVLVVNVSGGGRRAVIRQANRARRSGLTPAALFLVDMGTGRHR